MRYTVRLSAVLLAGFALNADVRVPALISDHMVLQQEAPVRIWGRADRGEQVSVRFLNQTVAVKADASGKWQAFLMPMKSGAAGDMTISGRNTITVRDVLVGEVWVASGQSNMQWTVDRSDNAEEEIRRANFPQIRFFNVKRVVADAPAADVEAVWEVCSPATVAKTSAVGYYFSRHLHQQRGFPVGLIHTSWGGTPAQSWTSRSALETEPALKFYFDDWQKTLDNYPAAKEKYDRAMEEWKKKAAEAKRSGASVPPQPRPPAGPGHQNTPAGLYNAMIAPLTPYAIRGAIWYQGESNANERQAFSYRRLFRLMIEDWRQAWAQGPFPFLFVQLANYKANEYWPVLRESQTDTLNLANTGMAVTIDIGNPKNIHPTNKQDVGKRLALWARAMTYGERNLAYSGPLYRQMAVEGSRIRLWFDHAGPGLAARGGGPLKGFELAGKDGNYVPATAAIDGSTVVVSNPGLSEAVSVRYAWSDDPSDANLINKDGLPASPFRAGENVPLR